MRSGEGITFALTLARSYALTLPSASTSSTMLSSRSRVSAGGAVPVHFDLVIIVWYCLPGNAGKARQPRLGGANNPYWRTALTSCISPECVDSVLKPLDQLGALRARIGAQMQLNVVLQRDWSKAGFHVRVLKENRKLGICCSVKVGKLLSGQQQPD